MFHPSVLFSKQIRVRENQDTYFLFSIHGLTTYWIIGSRRKAIAMAAMIAVKTAKRSCIESKKKNIMRREMEAPSGRHRACIVSRVWTLLSSPGPCTAHELDELQDGEQGWSLE